MNLPDLSSSLRLPLLLCGLLAGSGVSPAFSQNAGAPTQNAAPARQTQAQPQDPGNAPQQQSLGIQSTVTAAMGDVGGKYFGKAPDPAKVRHYYIAAEPELWDFAPLGQDPVCGKTFPDSLLERRSVWKIRYVQYADAAFTARVLPTERLGIMGPVLRGTTGQYIEVTFLNRSWRPVSMHPHGVKYDKDSEGSYYQPNPGYGAAVAPGAKFTYVWYLDKSSGPLPGEPSSKAWLYHSHVVGDEEINLGMIGSIIVTDPTRARPDGTPRDVDREMEALFLIFNEGDALNTGAGDADDKPDQPVQAAPTGVPAPYEEAILYSEGLKATEDGQRHTINGRTFGNLGGLEMNEGEHVRWYLFGLGSESDLHSAHWHGERVVVDGQKGTDVVELLPASMKVADMVADNPGTWLFHCHVAEHMSNGMFARFIVHPSGDPAAASRDPEMAFFGMPQSLATLRIGTAELALDKSKPESSEVDLTGQVTAPDPFPLLKNSFTIQIGSKSVTLQPDKSGLCVGPEAILLVKNGGAPGIVTGGTVQFELTLKGQGWIDALREQHLLDKNSLAPHPVLNISMLVGGAHHVASPVLKLAAQ